MFGKPSGMSSSEMQIGALHSAAGPSCSVVSSTAQVMAVSSISWPLRPLQAMSPVCLPFQHLDLDLS